MFVVFLIIFFVIAITFLSVFLVRMLLKPRRLGSVAELIKQQRYPQAEKLIKSIIMRETGNALAHYYLGKIYLAQNKPEIALMELKTVNSLAQFGPDVPEAEFRKLIASLYERFGQLEEALKEYIMLSKNEPNNAEYWYHCARMFEERGKLDVAVKYARKAVELDAKHGKAHYLLGLILYKTKHPLEAKAEFELAIKFEPSNYDSYFYLGKLHKESNDYTAALVALERAQKSPAFKVKALIERGGTFMNQGSFESASIELERAIKLLKDESSNEALYARYFLAISYEKLKNLDMAIEQWEKIYSKKPQFRDVAEKLQQYQEYRTDDSMKDYLSCSREKFVEICTAVVSRVMGLVVRDTMEITNGVDFVAVSSDTGKWLGARKIPHLIRFLRVSEPLDESAIRALLETMKQYSIIKSSFITSSTFTRTAVDFAQNRSVELFQKEQLQEFLKKTGGK